MRKQVVAVAVASALAFAVGASAQQSGKGQMMEAVVTVTKINPATRTVHVRTPKGETAVSVPADVKLDQLQVGARYRVRYQEAVAVAIEPGAQPSAGAGATAEVAPQSTPAAGQALKTDKVAGVIDAIDPGSKEITVRTLDGGKQTFKVAESVEAGSLKPGEAVTVTYEQAVATHMVSTPQPIRDPAPAR